MRDGKVLLSILIKKRFGMKKNRRLTMIFVILRLQFEKYIPYSALPVTKQNFLYPNRMLIKN